MRIDITGQTFGKWTVIKYEGRKPNGNQIYLCKCACGKEKIQIATYLTTGKTKSCKSCASRRQNAKDLTGLRFGKLIVLRRTENKGAKVVWLCKCDCGEYAEVTTNRLKYSTYEKCLHIRNKKMNIPNKYECKDQECTCYLDNGVTFIFDKDDYSKVFNKVWRTTQKQSGYVVARDYTFFHRFIMNAEKGEVVDHINGDIYDNRKVNLRICTHKENSRNRKLLDTNTSGATGVSWSKRDQKWYAYITVDYKKMRLGAFHDINEAIRVRREAEDKYFGEFAPNKNRNPI